MVLINKAINEVTVKLVYYGPGLCGKTTNLEKIYANPKLDNKGKMISMSTETDRTLFFDFMPMELGTIAGQKVRVQLYTVPGQVFYDATRKLVLRGADGVVFVADSQATMKESNLDSLENLRTNLRLNRIDPDKVAIVYQLNKRDLPNVSPVEEMKEYLVAGDAPVVEASAITGTGVTATLRAAVARILDNLKSNVDVTLYEQPPLAAPDMTARAGVTPSSAGTPKLSFKNDPLPAPQAQPAPAARPAAVAAQPASAAAQPAASPVRNTNTAPLTLPPEVLDPPPLMTSPFEADFDAIEATVDDDPFAHVAIAEPETEVAVIDDPFEAHPAEIHDTSAERAEVEAMLANARALIGALEIALDRAHESERMLSEKLAKL